MNEETRAEIKRLSDIAFDKAETCHALSLQNIGLPYEQRKEQAQRYALARYEMIMASAELERFIKGA